MSQNPQPWADHTDPWNQVPPPDAPPWEQSAPEPAPWDQPPAQPQFQQPAAAPAAPEQPVTSEPEPEPVEEPVVEPVFDGGTLNLTVQLPDAKFFKYDIEVSINEADKLPAWIRTKGKTLAAELAEALRLAGLVQAATTGGAGHAPTGFAGHVGVPTGAGAGAWQSGPVAGGTGAADAAALVAGQAQPAADGFMYMKNVKGQEVVAPACPTPQMEREVFTELFHQTGYHPKHFRMYDNRQPVLSGYNVGRIVLAGPVADQLNFKRAVAFIGYKNGAWTVEITKEFAMFAQYNPAAEPMLRGQVAGQ